MPCQKVTVYVIYNLDHMIVGVRGVKHGILGQRCENTRF